MALRGQSINVLLNPALAGELDQFETYAPAQIELTNGIRTLAGAWTRRPGYGIWKALEIQDSSPVIGVFDNEEQLVIIKESGRIYSCSEDTYRVLDGVVNVASRPRALFYNGDPIIVGGDKPVIIYQGQVRQLGLKVDPPSTAPSILPTVGEGSAAFPEYPMGPEAGIGRSAGMWVYAQSFMTPNGETQIGPATDPVLISYANQSVRVRLQGSSDPFVIGQRLYAARYIQDEQASVWRLVDEVSGRNICDVLDMVPDTKLGELDLPGASESDSFAPVGSRFIAIVADSIVVAGADRYSFQFCEPGKWISWPAENIRYVERDGGPITGLGTVGQTLLVFKRDSIEIWGVQGSQIPFTRRQKLDKGLLAPDALVKIGQSYISLDDNRELFKVGIEDLSPIVGNRDWFLDLARPELVYAIHFPLERRVRYYSKEADTVLVYDYQNNIFTKESHVNERGEQGMVPVLCGTTYKSKMIVGIRGKRDLYEWSTSYPTDSGSEIRVSRKLRVQLSAFGNSARVNRVRIRLKRNTPKNPSYLKPPFITVRWSLDGVCFNQEELYLVQDCDGPYVDLCVLGVGRELIMEIIEADTEDYMLTHAFVTAQDLGR